MHPWAAKRRAYGIPISGNLQTATGQSPGQVAPALESALVWAGGWIGDLQGPTLLLLWFYESGMEEMSLLTKPGALVQPQKIVPIFPLHSHLHPANGTSSLAEHGESLSVLRCLFQKHTAINCSALFFLFKLSETSWVSQRSQGISWGGIWMLWNKCHFPRGSRVTWMGAHIRASAELHY